MEYTSTMNSWHGSRRRALIHGQSVASSLCLRLLYLATRMRACSICASLFLFAMWLVYSSAATADELPAALPLRAVVATEQPLKPGAITRIGKRHFGHNRWTRLVAWRLGTGQFATAGDDGFVRVWDAVSRRELFRSATGGRIPRVLRYTADGQQLLVVVDGNPGRVIRWDANTGEILTENKLPNLHRPDSWGFALGSPQLDRLAVAKGSVLKVYDLDADRLIYELDMTTIPKAHRSANGRVYLGPMDFSPDGHVLYVSIDDGILPLLPDEQCQLPRLEVGPPPQDPQFLFWPTDLVVSSDGRWLAACRNRWTMIFDLKAGKRRHILTDDSGRHDLVRFSPNSKILAGGGHYGHVKLWDVASGAMLNGFPVSHNQLVDVAFSEHGKLLVLARLNEAIRILEVATANEKTVDMTPVFRVGLDFSSDGATLATLGERKQLFFWNAETGEPSGQIELPPSPSHKKLLSPDMKWFIAPNRETEANHDDWCIYDLSSRPKTRLSKVINAGELPAWKVADSDVITALRTIPSRSFAFDSDSKFLVGCGTDWGGRVITKRRWKMRTGKLVAAVAVPVDGKSLAKALAATKEHALSISAYESSAHLTPLANGRLALLSPGLNMLMPDLVSWRYTLFDLEKMEAIEMISSTIDTRPPQSSVLEVGGPRLGLSEHERELLSDYKGRVTVFVRDAQRHLLIIATERRDPKPTGEWQIIVFDTEAQVPVSTFDAGQVQISELAISPNATRLASGHSNGTVILWQLTAGR